MMTKTELLIGLSEYYGKNLSESQVVIYLKGLSNITVEELDGAIDEIVRESKWFPKVNEIIAYVERNKGREYEINRETLLYWHMMDEYNSMLRGDRPDFDKSKESHWVSKHILEKKREIINSSIGVEESEDNYDL